MRNLILALTIVTLATSCSDPVKGLKPGIWRGVIGLQGQRLPFQFDVQEESPGKMMAFIHNSTERIKLEEIEFFDQDSISIVLHIFDAQLRVRNHGDSLTGFYIKNYVDNYKIPFTAYFGQDYRFARTSSANTDFSGKYDVQFIDNGGLENAVGIFEQHASNVSGTFLLSTGDYRYLEGDVVDEKLHLSTFDGNHAYLFTAVMDNDTLRGDFWSGKTYHALWTGVRNDSASLPDSEHLTYLKEGYDRIEFHFPDLNGDTISLSDDRFHNKVVILQLLGSWCPNCMDETIFLRDWYTRNKDRGIEILGLAYEQKADFNYARNRVAKMKERLNVDYPVVIAGTQDKDEASKTLPMLNQIMAFPTMIILGKDGAVKHIHTGFSGPGTGIYYEQFRQRFDEVINELLAENPPS